MSNHAEAASRAAINMVFALDKINEEFAAKKYPTINIGIGINTGQMSVGNMGSDERFQYTVMGDSVNIGQARSDTVKSFENPKDFFLEN